MRIDFKTSSSCHGSVLCCERDCIGLRPRSKTHRRSHVPPFPNLRPLGDHLQYVIVLFSYAKVMISHLARLGHKRRQLSTLPLHARCGVLFRSRKFGLKSKRVLAGHPKAS